MALPSSGAISFSQINTELGVSSTAQRSLNDSTTRTLFGKASGAISMSDGYGKANQFAFTISSNQTNANLRSLAVAAGWDQSSKVVATIGSGVYISSNSTGAPGLTINGSFPGGVELVNNGFIVGMGGAGGGGGGDYRQPPYSNYGQAGFGGGLALSVSVGVSINNVGSIAGGGGGGGGGGAGSAAGYISPGGGGGGGRTGLTNSAGGVRGTVGGSTGGSAGAAGTSSNPGGGGGGGSFGNSKDGNFSTGGTGGSGGGWGASGSSGASANWSGGGGGSAGAAVSGNSNITWVSTGTRLGAIS